jgi:hypothetical protein
LIRCVSQKISPFLNPLVSLLSIWVTHYSGMQGMLSFEDIATQSPQTLCSVASTSSTSHSDSRSTAPYHHHSPQLTKTGSTTTTSASNLTCSSHGSVGEDLQSHASDEMSAATQGTASKRKRQDSKESHPRLLQLEGIIRYHLGTGKFFVVGKVITSGWLM